MTPHAHRERSAVQNNEMLFFSFFFRNCTYFGEIEDAGLEIDTAYVDTLSSCFLASFIGRSSDFAKT